MRASAEALAEALRERGYPVHPAVLAFEARWGGVLIGDGPAEDPHANEEDYWLGAFACIVHGGHSNPRGDRDDLVPVMYSPNDNIWYLDANGTAWGEDTIEGPGPIACARSAETMLADSLLACEMWRREMRTIYLERAVGGEIAAALGLPVIAEATDELVHWWGDGVTLVRELRDDDGQWITAAVSNDPALLARWSD